MRKRIAPPPLTLPLPAAESVGDVEARAAVQAELEGEELENIRALKRIRKEGGVAGANAIRMLREIMAEKRPLQSRQVRVSFDVGSA
jgi:hypothetical protein